MNSDPISRRRFLGYMGAAVGGYAVLRTGPAAAAGESTWVDGPDLVAGVVDHVDVNNLYVEGPNSESLTTVRTSGGTTIWREGEVRLSVFERGDEVLAQGQWDGRDFAASYVTSLYHNLEGIVQSRKGRELQTTNGIVALVPETQPVGDPGVALAARSVNAISAGDRIFVGGRLNRSTGKMVALRVGVYEV
jgi:hypothetical protein